MLPLVRVRPSRRTALATLLWSGAALLSQFRRPATAAARDRSLFLQTTDIAGTQYYRAPEIADRLKPGQPLRLRREPENPYDDLAIEVFTTDGFKLGYVPRIHNAPYARLMDAGRTVVAEIYDIDRSRRRYGGWGFIEMRLSLFE